MGGRLALDVQHDLRRQVFAAVQRLDGERQDALRTGQVVSRAITDLNLLQGAALDRAALARLRSCSWSASLVAMLWLSPLLTVVALVVLPVAAWIAVRSRKALFPATWSAQQRAADIAQHVEETVTGVRVVKGFGQEAARGRHARSGCAAAVRRAAARGAAHRPAQPRAAEPAHPRAGRGDRPRRLARARRLDQLGHVPRVHRLRSRARRASPAARRAGRVRPAGQGGRRAGVRPGRFAARRRRSGASASVACGPARC